MKIFRNRTAIGVLCILLALIICFGITPLFSRSASEKTEIVRVTKDIKEGDEITAEMVQTVEVGAYNLPQNLMTDKKEVVGKYATADLAAGDYILSSKLSAVPAAENAYLYNLDGTKQAISVTIKSFATGLSGKLESGDIVTVIVADYQGKGETAIPPELQYVEVISVTASSGYDANTGEVVDEKELPSTVTLLVTTEQAKVLAELEQDIRGAGDPPKCQTAIKKWASHRKERPAMKENAPRVIKIPAKPEATRQAEARRQLRVAAYCRVSTKEEDQANSYEVQKEYYTDKIMSNTAWTMAGIFADKGITGTSAKKREDFMRMIRHCRQKKIDVILTKSVSRFSRNTVDCLYYIRALKQLGIAVIFEKENINSLEEDSELRITLSGAFAQSESESISANVTWGKRRAMEAGKVSIQYKKLYGYRKGEDGQPEIIPEQAEIVRWLYERYLTGASLRMIKDELEQQGVKCFEDSPEWTISRIRSILQNEKYCGDVLMQKTFRQDFINRKAIKNTGQLPMYLIENHHESIVSREKYDAVQAEMARRNAAKSPSKNAVTGMASYASKYALSERLVCGECGTLYRRCTWTRNGEKRVVWRCVSRLDYGKKYCHNSPTLDEAPLQQAILAALNTAMADKNSLIRQITDAMETEIIPFPGGTMSLGDIERRLRELEKQFQTLLEKATDDPAAYGSQFKEILDEQTFLKEKRSEILADNNEQAKANQRIMDAAQTLENASPHITEWDESAVRQLVETVKVLSKDEIAVTLKGGIEIPQKIMY